MTPGQQPIRDQRPSVAGAVTTNQCCVRGRVLAEQEESKLAVKADAAATGAFECPPTQKEKRFARARQMADLLTCSTLPLY